MLNESVGIGAVASQVDAVLLLSLQRIGTGAGLRIWAIVAITVSTILAVILCCLGFSLLHGVFKRTSQAPGSYDSTEEAAAKVHELEQDEDRTSIQQHIATLDASMDILRQEHLKAQEGTRRAEVDAEVAAAEASAAAGAEATAGDIAEDAQCLRRQAEAAAKAMEERLRQAEAVAEQLRHLSEEASQKTEQIAELMVEGVEQALHQLEAFVREAVQVLTVQIEEAIAGKASKDEVEALTKEAEDSAGQILRMPLPLLLAGLLAPMQLQAMISWNCMMVLVQVPALLALMAVMFIDYGKSCGHNELWVWASIMATMLKVNISLRLWVMRHASTCLSGARSDEQVRAGLLGDDHPLHRFCNSIMASSKDYFKALLAYDGISRSLAGSLLSLISVAFLVWGGAGVYFVILYVVEEELSCDAKYLRAVSRCFAFFYVIFFLWSLAALAIRILELIMTSKWMALQVLEMVWSLDDQFSPSGFPVVSILVRALLLRSDKDMKNVEASILRSEIAELKEKKAELARQEASVNGLLEAAVRRSKVATGPPPTSTAEELCALYSRDLIALMDKVAIFTLTVQEQVKKLSPSDAEGWIMRKTRWAASEHHGHEAMSGDVEPGTYAQSAHT